MPPPNDKKKIDKSMAFREGVVELVKEVTDSGEVQVKTVRLSVSSEAPYYRSWMWDERTQDYIKGYEVLGHAEGEIDFTRMKDGLVIQDTHWGDQIGLMRKPEVKDGKLCGEVEFCCGPRAQEIKQDAIKGLRRNMSVGYRVQEYKLVGEAEDGNPIYRAVKWMPHEASFVNCPADTEVGVGRSQENNTAATPAVVQKKGIQIMDKPEVKAGLTADNVVEAFRLAKAANIEAGEVDALIKSGKSFDEIRGELVGKVEKRMAELEKARAEAAKKPDTPAAKKDAAGGIVDDATRKEITKHYSVAKVLRALAGASVDIGYEREVSQEMESKTGRKAQGIIIPDFVRSEAGSETFARPAHGTVDGLGGWGAATIATNLLAGSFIEALRDALVLGQAGMQTLAGLVGDIAIPKGGKVQAAWISAENGDASKTNPTLGQLTATPKTIGAYVDMTRKLLLQSSIDVQGFCVRELVYAIAHGLEAAGFNGSGTNGEPAGLLGKIANTVSFTPGALTKAKVLEMITKIDEANGNLGSMKFIGRPSVWGAFGGTLDFTTIVANESPVAGVTSGKYLLDTATNKMEGYDFIKSNIAPAKTVMFGDWSQLMLCLWSGTDIVVDQYSGCTKGALRVVALQDADFIVRQPEAFSKGTTVIQ